VIRWFKYLIDEDVEFHIRIPKQIKVGSLLLSNRKTVSWLFRHWKENSKTDYHKPVKILGYSLWVSGMKSEKGYCVIVSNKNNSLEKYQLRWTIENMFEHLRPKALISNKPILKTLKRSKNY